MMKSRRVVVGVLALTIVLALGVLGYTVRDRWMWKSAAVPPLVTAETAGGGASSSETQRGDVSIDSRRQQLIGVRLARVERTSLASTIRTTGVVRYDETRLSEVNLKLEGWIRDLYVDYTGQPVRRGQRLFSLYSPDLLATQSEYLLALKTRDQIKGSQVADARDYADRLVDAARQRILLWDLSPDDIRTLDETRQPRTEVTFTSPASGYVIEKQALQGMHVMPGQTLYKIADLSVVWVEADIYEQDMPFVRVGQSATVTLDAYPGAPIAGRAVYIYPYVEEKSRTVKVRFQLANASGRLKPGMFANVELRTAGGTGLTIPANALLDSGSEQIVFVAHGDGNFAPTRVKAGRRLGDMVEIREGLKEGDQVASSAAFFLDSESQLRAGLQNYEAPEGAAPAQSGSAQQVDISFRPQPDPPRTGESTFEVTVKDAAGQPVTDADVSVVLFMPAMPTMNMPAMRNETKLAQAGAGVYRGPGQVVMAGRWEVTVTVSRGGQRLGTRQFAMAAR
jgi:RND family efflux transporter MFP subunit